MGRSENYESCYLRGCGASLQRRHDDLYVECMCTNLFVSFAVNTMTTRRLSFDGCVSAVVTDVGERVTQLRQRDGEGRGYVKVR